MGGVERSLKNDRQAEEFVTKVLQFKDSKDIREAIRLITAAEGTLDDYANTDTFDHDNYRDYEYKSTTKRLALREQIITELITQERPDKDDDIKLGFGGAKPIGIDPQKDRNAYIVIGLPASGKSGTSNIIADRTASYLLDSDIVKRKLPEYEGKVNGASLVHNESAHLVYSYKVENRKQLNLLNYCSENGYNMVIAKIGHRADNICELAVSLRAKRYKTYLILVELERTKATIRAYNRYKETGRYVPLSVIFDLYANDPTITYYRLKSHSSGQNVFNGFLHLSNDVPRGEPPYIVEKTRQFPDIGFTEKRR